MPFTRAFLLHSRVKRLSHDANRDQWAATEENSNEEGAGHHPYDEASLTRRDIRGLSPASSTRGNQ